MPVSPNRAVSQGGYRRERLQARRPLPPLLTHLSAETAIRTGAEPVAPDRTVLFLTDMAPKDIAEPAGAVHGDRPSDESRGWLNGGKAKRGGFCRHRPPQSAPLGLIGGVRSGPAYQQ